MSDPDEHHDHPWNYLSIILWGGYYEETLSPDRWIGKTCQKWYGPLSFLKRDGSKYHRIILPENKFAVTLVFTSKKYKKWNFIKSQIVMPEIV